MGCDAVAVSVFMCCLPDRRLSVSVVMRIVGVVSIGSGLCGCEFAFGCHQVNEYETANLKNNVVLFKRKTRFVD